MGETMGQDQKGLCGQKAYRSCRENKSKYYCELHKRTVHGQFWRCKGNISEIHHKLIPQWKILHRQTSQDLW